MQAVVDLKLRFLEDCGWMSWEHPGHKIIQSVYILQGS